MSIIDQILNQHVRIDPRANCVFVTTSNGVGVTKMYRDFETKQKALEAAVREAVEWASVVYAPSMAEIREVRLATGKPYAECHRMLMAARGR